jgi:methyl-accepting chemotaxis protein
MNFVRNMKLSHLIIMVAIVPLVATVFFASQTVYNSWQKSQEMQSLGQLMSLSTRLSALVHEQQKERGATAGFISSRGANFSTELTAQRGETDAQRAQLESFLADFESQQHGATFTADVKAILAGLDEMQGIREQVDAFTISGPDAIGYYTGLNGQSLDLIGSMATLSSDPTVVTRIFAYSSFLEGKERAGIERAVGSNGLAAGRFSSGLMDKFKLLISVQDTFNATFLAYATAEQEAFFESIMTGEAATAVQGMRDTIVAGGVIGNVGGLTAESWFSTITAKINGLKQIDDELSSGLIAELSTLEAAAAQEEWWAIAEVLAALAIVIALATLIIRGINRSFRDVISVMTRLAGGDLEVELPPIHANEIGSIMQSVQVFKDSAIEKVELTARQADDEKRAEEEQHRLMQSMADDFESRVGNVISIVSSAATELTSTAQSMSAISGETSSQATAVASASEESAANVQTVAAAAEEMATSVADTNQRVMQAADASNSAVARVDHTRLQVEALAEMTDKINEVVSMISGIAEQTNLLALNATIESARAGEAGKGFAVVAAEVKELANQTGKATEGISLQIEEIQAATGEAVTSMIETSEVIKQLNETSTHIASTMEQQRATTQEISQNVQQAAAGTDEVSQSITSVNQAAQEAGEAAGQVTEAAGELSKQTEVLKSEVDQFIAQVRAG